MKKGKWLIYFVLILAVAVMTIPFLWMLLTSFKTFEDSTKIPLQILPEQWILTNYTEILEVFPIAKWFMNSILAVVLCNKYCPQLYHYCTQPQHILFHKDCKN